MVFALEDIKVIDFGQFVAGPVAARLMADLGAKVIKVEPLEGESLRPQRNSLDAFTKTFQQGNAGKRAIAIDLRTEEGVTIIQKLTATADVVSNNFRPDRPMEFHFRNCRRKRRPHVGDLCFCPSICPFLLCLYPWL